MNHIIATMNSRDIRNCSPQNLVRTNYGKQTHHVFYKNSSREASGNSSPFQAISAGGETIGFSGSFQK